MVDVGGGVVGFKIVVGFLDVGINSPAVWPIHILLPSFTMLNSRHLVCPCQ